MVTKIKGLLWFGVLAVVGVVAVTQLHIFGSAGAPLRVHSPTTTAVQRARVVRFFAAWPRLKTGPLTPTVITYWIGNQEVQLQSWQLPGDRGSWHRDVPYDPKQAYTLTVDQGHIEADKTDCEVSILDTGFSDSDRITGSGAARCWINPAKG